MLTVTIYLHTLALLCFDTVIFTSLSGTLVAIPRTFTILAVLVPHLRSNLDRKMFVGGLNWDTTDGITYAISLQIFPLTRALLCIRRSEKLLL